MYIIYTVTIIILIAHISFPIAVCIYLFGIGCQWTTIFLILYFITIIVIVYTISQAVIISISKSFVGDTITVVVNTIATLWHHCFFFSVAYQGTIGMPLTAKRASPKSSISPPVQPEREVRSSAAPSVGMHATRERLETRGWVYMALP